MKYSVFLLFGALFLSITACNPSSAAKVAEKQPAVENPPVSDDSLIAQTTREILTLFRDKAYKAIGAYVHPEKGVRFSPYPYIDTTADLRFTAEQLRDAVKKRRKLDWGHFDGSGDPIILTFGEYAGRFVYDADFLNAEEALINRSKGFGNTIDNRAAVYGGKPYVCCYFSGLDPQYEGMDWRSLHLVYEIENGKAWLIGVVHGEWTI